MTQHLVVTLLSDDRPGLVEQVSAAVTMHHGSWQESSMAQLAGKFAGILRVAIPPEHAPALQGALQAIAGLKVIIETAGLGAPPTRNRRLSFSLVGHDRIGIVREISQVFARHGVNVEKLTTFTTSAPMSSELLFHAEAELRADDTLDAAALQADLEKLSNDLIADINLDERIH